MSSVTNFPEQDAGGGDGEGLPTYENLAQEHGPNSRFGRWKSWVEKRAAERYADITPEELERRRQRGWGDGMLDDAVSQGGPSTSQSSAAVPTLHLNCDAKPLPSPPIQLNELLEYDPSQPIAGESLRPAHLGLHQLGSRFLPHASYPIRALLPLLGGRLLLIGHDDGLSVLNMFPQEWTDIGLQTRGPREAEAHTIWTGEGVFQMSLLEVEEIGETTPQGVVLFLVGSDLESGKEQESIRILRMYNLASLISLARWAISQKGARPLNLHRPPSWHPHRSTLKKHKQSVSLAKGLRSLVLDSPQDPEPPSSYQPMRRLSPDISRKGESRRSQKERLSLIDSSWDVVDDLPLRWATDYVPLAAPGSRLMNASVLTYALWRNDDQPRSSSLLAIAIKSAVLLYESPKSERAFRFVKEFYVPLSPRGISFVHQSLQDNLSRSVSDATYVSRPTSQHPRMRGSRHSMRQRPMSLTTMAVNPQLSLFVVFEKKVGLIRLINSAVGEVSLFEESAAPFRDSSFSSSPLSATSVASLSGRRSRTSLDGFGLARDNRGTWTLPAKLDLPTSSSATSMAASIDAWNAAPSSPEEAAASAAAASGAAGRQPQSVYLMTRGKQSFALPCPLPANLQGIAPLLCFSWRSPPTFVVPRIVEIEIDSSSPRGAGGGSGGIGQPETPPDLASAPACRRVLQLTAFNEDGLEIQEIPLSSLFPGLEERGKQREREREREKARAEEPSPYAVPVVSEVVIGDTGFLCPGGHWHRPYDAPLDLSRSYSTRSGMSFSSMATEEVVSRLESDQGIYGWQRKGLEDWRVFWIGGLGEEQRTDED